MNLRLKFLEFFKWLKGSQINGEIGKNNLSRFMFGPLNDEGE